ncbi:hypothetical protein E2C01_000111 [Portunus trituberculatus]|uniref:Uncharacterized protein n=1 Tax=Portunus trituberculatus TaxID=210409 RepID=A0A5B7CDR8_PORTR|nr:hypothetical protein [Portunus trituberculatus]
MQCWLRSIPTCSRHHRRQETKHPRPVHAHHSRQNFRACHTLVVVAVVVVVVVTGGTVVVVVVMVVRDTATRTPSN